jgi:YD repeat-containing protein
MRIMLSSAASCFPGTAKDVCRANEWSSLAPEGCSVRRWTPTCPRTSEHRSDASREMRMDDGVVKTEDTLSHVQHVRFQYQYDAYGNWTERIVSQRLEPNADMRPSNIERRTITYYTESSNLVARSDACKTLARKRQPTVSESEATEWD